MVCYGVLVEPNTESSFNRQRRRVIRNQHHQATTCSAAAVSSIITSLNLSLFTFHRHLLRCFSRFFNTATGTPSHRALTTKKQGYKKLKKLKKHRKPLRKRNNKKRTIFLDLDETLVHSTMQPPRVKADFVVKIKIDGGFVQMYVVKRPGVDEFLNRISKNYRVVVFTAGLPGYASQVLDKLDKKRIISQRLYRNSCTEINGRYAKDLTLMARKDFGSVLLVDDNPFSYSLQPENGIPIKPFFDDMEDEELLKLAEFFDGCYQYEDLRDAATDFVSKKLS